VNGIVIVSLGLLITAGPDDPADACGVPGERDEVVARATRCAEGRGACCADLLFERGWGLVSPDRIPADLAERLVPVLAASCAGGDPEDCRSWNQLLVRLGRTEEALANVESLCRKGSRSACLQGAKLLEERDVARAADLADRGCEMREEESCRLAGELWAKLRRNDKAASAFRRGCERDDLVSCAQARLLALGSKRGRWDVVVRHGEDALVVEETGKGRARVRMHTMWANGHTCGYDGQGSISGDKVILDPEGPGPDACSPILKRRDGTFTISDPGHHCQDHCGMRGSFETTF